MLVAGMHGEEEQLVFPEAGCQGSEQAGRVILISEQHHLGLTHGAAKGAVDVAATDTCDNIWEGRNGKSVKVFGCSVACNTRKPQLPIEFLAAAAAAAAKAGAMGRRAEDKKEAASVFYLCLAIVRYGKHPRFHSQDAACNNVAASA